MGIFRRLVPSKPHQTYILQVPIKSTESFLFVAQRSLLINDAECDFYLFLSGWRYLRRRCVVQCKVRLADVADLDKRRPHLKTLADTETVNRQHVDFLLCDRKTFQPLLVIELDGPPHVSDPGTQERDRKKDQILAAVGIPLMRVPLDHQKHIIKRDIKTVLSKPPSSRTDLQR